MAVFVYMAVSACIEQTASTSSLHCRSASINSTAAQFRLLPVWFSCQAFRRKPFHVRKMLVVDIRDLLLQDEDTSDFTTTVTKYRW